MKPESTEKNCRLGKVGGQAVLEGVMMKSGKDCATACRLPDGRITVIKKEFVSLRKKNKFFDLPIIRGVVNFAEMMMLSVGTINDSAAALFPEEENEKPSKFEEFMKNKLHVDIVALASVLGVILGLVLSVALFIWLPRLVSGLILKGEELAVVRALLEGVLKVGIFIGYIALVGLMKDIRRTFEYHGAEHKSVACYEAGDELTPEAARKYTRFHPRCGTSFMFVMIFLGILAGVLVNSLFPNLKNILYVLIKLLILPFVVGIGFEFIMYAGKHDNLFVRIVSAPGLWMQRLTTREPDDSQLECAITALKCAIKDEFPDFDASTYDRSVKPDPNGAAASEDETAETAAPVANEPVTAEDGTVAGAAPVANETAAENTAAAVCTQNAEGDPAAVTECAPAADTDESGTPCPDCPKTPAECTENVSEDIPSSPDEGQ